MYTNDLGPGYYQQPNGNRGMGYAQDYNKISRTETLYVQGNPGIQNQQPHGSALLKDSLKKSIFGNQEQELYGRSKPGSRTMTPTQKLRGNDPYTYGGGNLNVSMGDPRVSDANAYSNVNYQYQQQKQTQSQPLYGQDPYIGGGTRSGTRTPIGFPRDSNNPNQQGYYGQSQQQQQQSQYQYQANQGQPPLSGGQNYGQMSYQQQQQQIGRTPIQNQQVFTNPTPLKGPTDGIQRSSTVVKVDPSLTSNIASVRSPHFSEKRVIVTGASSGIGRAVAMWFLNSGARVALIGRDLEALITVGKQFPSQALVIKCDLSKDDQPYDMYNTVMSEFGGVDILVNAAGILKEGDIKNMLPQDFDQVMDVNLRSVFYLSYLFFPALQKSKGCVINLSCQYGTKPFAGLYAYCMSKAGIECLSKQMAYEFASSGVRVNAVAPGFVETNLLVYQKVPQSDIETIAANVERYTPLKRTATIDDVGKAIIFLSSPAAAHITGQVLKIDGGRSLTTSNWHQWEGPKANNVIIESRESIIQSFKGKVLAPSNIMLGYTELERINALTKRTNWSTTDTNAHATIKFAKYQEQDVRHNIQDSEHAIKNSLGKMFI